MRAAVALIDALDPAVGVEAVGSRLCAPGGGINELNGCEGIDVVFLLRVLVAAGILIPLVVVYGAPLVELLLPAYRIAFEGMAGDFRLQALAIDYEGADRVMRDLRYKGCGRSSLHRLVVLSMGLCIRSRMTLVGRYITKGHSPLGLVIQVAAIKRLSCRVGRLRRTKRVIQGSALMDRTLADGVVSPAISQPPQEPGHVPRAAESGASASRLSFASLVAIGLLAAIATTSAHATLDDARAKGLKWLVQTQKGDGSFSGSQGLEVQSTAAAVEAMIAGGMTKSPQYSRALSWLANAPGGSLDSRAWQAMALAAAGRDASNIAGVIRDERDVITAMNGSLSSGVAVWGPFPGYTASAPDTALGFGALRSAGVSYTNDTNELTSTVLCKTLGAQLTASPWAGAWPYALPQTYQPGANTSGSLLTTALTLFELKKQRLANRFLSGTACSRTSPSAIDTSMVSAKTWLIAQANGDGGFAERNPQSGVLEASSPVATALAVRALAQFAAEGDSAATTAVNNARNWLSGQADADGSWRGDPFVTARVIAALPAATGAQIADTDNDGLPDVVEQQLGSQVASADSQTTLSNNAAASLGITAPAFAASATVGQPFAYTLSASGGTGPYSFGLKNGALPPGLTLASGGQIAGTPAGTGSYAFDYEVTDALGDKTQVIGRIDVAEVVAAANEGDVPIPGWALFALAASMVAAIRRKTS